MKTITDREIIQQSFEAVGSTFPLLPMAEKVHEVAMILDIRGYGDRITTRQITRQLRQTGRA